MDNMNSDYQNSNFSLSPITCAITFLGGVFILVRHIPNSNQDKFEINYQLIPSFLFLVMILAAILIGTFAVSQLLLLIFSQSDSVTALRKSKDFKNLRRFFSVATIFQLLVIANCIYIFVGIQPTAFRYDYPETEFIIFDILLLLMIAASYQTISFVSQLLKKISAEDQQVK